MARFRLVIGHSYAEIRGIGMSPLHPGAPSASPVRWGEWGIELFRKVDVADLAIVLGSIVDLVFLEGDDFVCKDTVGRCQSVYGVVSGRARKDVVSTALLASVTDGSWLEVDGVVVLRQCGRSSLLWEISNLRRLNERLTCGSRTSGCERCQSVVSFFHPSASLLSKPARRFLSNCGKGWRCLRLASSQDRR